MSNSLDARERERERERERQEGKAGGGNFPGNNSISWRHFSCFNGKEAGSKGSSWEEIILAFSAFSHIGARDFAGAQMSAVGTASRR